MFKMLGILCIVSGSSGLGFLYARELELRLIELKQLQQMLLQLRGEIRYMHQPLPDAFWHLSRKAPVLFVDFLTKMAQELQKRDGQSAEEIWKRNLKKCLIGLHLDKQEQKDLEKLGSMLGYLDVDMQLNALDYYLEQLKESSLRATEVSKTQKKLYQSMGILGGAALALLVR